MYHSVYDDIFWMNNFGDPGYHYHKGFLNKESRCSYFFLSMCTNVGSHCIAVY